MVDGLLTIARQRARLTAESGRFQIGPLGRRGEAMTAVARIGLKQKRAAPPAAPDLPLDSILQDDCVKAMASSKRFLS